ncbi:Uncharacterised protein [Klebsiella michiganensis]|uniref:Uncharacterized protein n=1 Tax=Klebsiella michiganensis TaxID=1134687 RepID=A0A7H4PLB1_9ENTR|nr:Uncharacterised protein [Klebsiella michiganensis]
MLCIAAPARPSIAPHSQRHKQPRQADIKEDKSLLFVHDVRPPAAHGTGYRRASGSLPRVRPNSASRQDDEQRDSGDFYRRRAQQNVPAAAGQRPKAGATDGAFHLKNLAPIKINTGAPTSAVIAPVASSWGATRVRAAISASSSTRAPTGAASGSRQANIFANQPAPPRGGPPADKADRPGPPPPPSRTIAQWAVSPSRRV